MCPAPRDPMDAPTPEKPPEQAPGLPPESPAPTPPPAADRHKLRHLLFGPPRDVQDPRTHHHISLIALLAWVGLGADGLSSSAYGPDEAFRALGKHGYLAVALALATAVNVLTISVSVASCGDAIFSFLPPALATWKLLFEAAGIALLLLLNLRGVKESVSFLAPIFGLFLVTHVILLVGGLGTHVTEVPRVGAEVAGGFRAGLAELGAAGLFMVFVRAYSMGTRTYTGIEAVSNGIQIMRERPPR